MKSFSLPTLGTLVVATLACLVDSASAESLRVGVWNIEKLSTSARRGFPELSDGNQLPPRSSQQLAKMADYIENQLQADVLLVTEIDADSNESTVERPQSEQLNEVCRTMGDEWRYFLSRTGGDMRLGVVFNSDKIRLKKIVNLEAEPFSVSGADVYDRDPFLVWIESTGENPVDVLLACLHLKSVQDTFRDNRLAAIAKLVGDLRHKATREAIGLPGDREEPEVLILGDCNDSSFKLNGFRFMFDYLEGVGFAHLKPDGDYPPTRINGSQIDHIFATEAAINNLIVDGSFQVHHVPQNQRVAYRRDLSDHFPVTVDLVPSSGADLLTNNPLNRESPLADAGRVRAFRGVLELEENDVDDEGEARMVPSVEIIEGDFERILAPAISGISTQKALGDELPLRAERAGSTPKFDGKVVGEWLESADKPDRLMVLTEDFSFIDSRGVRWNAPKGSIVDGASIPPVFWNKFIGPPFVGDYRQASVVHDVACERKDQPHRETHRMFYEGCLAGGLGKGKALAMYWAVRTFGPTWEEGAAPTLETDMRTLKMEDLAACYEVLEVIEGNPELEFDKVEAMLDQALGEE